MDKALQAEALKAVVDEQCCLTMDVVVHESIASTNSWSLQQIKAGKNPPFACFAEAQTQGQGRRGKHWLTPPYANIAMSLAWSFSVADYSALHLLSLSVALAVAETLESFAMQQVQIKWPNDVYVNGKKISGILIEVRSSNVASTTGRAKEDRPVAVVIGVGLNYDMTELVPGELLTPAAFTDIRQQCAIQNLQKLPQRAEVTAKLLCNVINVCQHFRFNAKQNLHKFREHYDYCKQKKVEIILDDKKVLNGIAQGITDQAELLVSVDGVLHVFNSAEVSVKAGL